MIVGGIDPGITGAVASWDGKDLAALKVPSVKAKGRGNTIDWTQLASSMSLYFEFVEHFYIEEVSAMPGQGVSSMFKFGYVAGGLRGLVAAMHIPVTMVRANVWKPSMAVTKDKKQTAARAAELFPKDAHLFYGPRGGVEDGLAEAALIAFYGRKKLVGV